MLCQPQPSTIPHSFAGQPLCSAQWPPLTSACSLSVFERARLAFAPPRSLIVSAPSPQSLGLFELEF
jgi:hypothetical protein